MRTKKMATWQEIHDDAVVVDLHIHPSLKSSLFHRDLSQNQRRRLFWRSFWPVYTRTSFPKLIAGGYDVALSTAYVPEQGWLNDLPVINLAKWLNPKAWREIFEPSYFDATNALLDQIESQVFNWNIETPARTPDREIRLVSSGRSLKKGIADGALCLVHAVEGAHSLHGELCGKSVNDSLLSTDEEIEDEIIGNLEKLHARGVASLILAHFYPNLVAPPCFPYPEYALKFAKKERIIGQWQHDLGLTKVGEAVVKRMLELGMIIDVTHCTARARWEVYQIVDKSRKKSCVIASHAGAYAVNPDPYCLKDWEIRWIAVHGGVVAPIFMNYWLSPVDTKFGLKYLMQTVDHLFQIGGSDVVAIGTDFDGFTDPPDELASAEELPRFTRELVSQYSADGRRYSNKVVKKFLGGNALRVLFDGWK